MRADVLQTVALCCHGNSFLAGLDGENPPELVGHNRAFKGVEDVTFERTPLAFKSNGPIPVAGGTGPWLRRLKHEGVERLELRLSKCSLDQSKSGSWGITTEGDIGLELWQPSAKARMVTYGEPLVWNVRFSADRIQRWTLGPQITLEKACGMLLKALDEAEMFADDHGSDETRAILQRAMLSLNGDGGEAAALTDLLPAQMDTESRRIISAGLASMLVIFSSAWNREELAKRGAISSFDTLSQLVWKCSMTVFESAVNSWQPSAGELRKAA